MNKTGTILLALLLAACGEQQKTAPKQDQQQQPAPEATAGDTMARGVTWLRAKAQDGIWMGMGREGPAPSAAYTALALTPIAAALPADKRASDPLVKKASAFILSCLSEDGAVRQGPASKYDNYFTSAALMALEAVGDPATAAQRKQMRDFILTLQRKEEGRIKGGIGYNTAKSADLSNSQFAIEALRAAGIPEDHPSMKQAKEYLERVQNRSENEANKGAAYDLEDPDTKKKVKVVPGNDGSAGYEPGVSKAGLHRLPDGTYIPRGYGSMTYALLKCYILVGVPADDVKVKAALQWLGENYTWEKNPGFDVVAKLRKDAPYWGLYYYYMTAAKALRLTGVAKLDTPDGPRDWRADLKAALAKRQKADGSWVNDQSERWEEADPIITTAYALIALQEIEGIK